MTISSFGLEVGKSMPASDGSAIPVSGDPCVWVGIP